MLAVTIGTPALELLDQDVDCYVLELSSYQLETTYSLKPMAATVLNLSEDHLDRYKSYADYVQAKLHIYDSATICVSNLDDETTRHNSADVLFSLSDSDADFSLWKTTAFGFVSVEFVGLKYPTSK